jgi:hypothetical protein
MPKWELLKKKLFFDLRVVFLCSAVSLLDSNLGT